MAAVHRTTAARQAITRLQGVVKEAVHVKIHPRPRNLAESREILRILQQYGEVAVYKHLKYESVAPAHNTVIAIYQNVASAQKLIDASPIRFEMQDGVGVQDGNVSSRPPPQSLRGNSVGLDAEERHRGEKEEEKENPSTDKTHSQSDSDSAKENESEITSNEDHHHPIKNTVFKGFIGGNNHTKWSDKIFSIKSGNQQEQVQQLPNSPAPNPTQGISFPFPPSFTTNPLPLSSSPSSPSPQKPQPQSAHEISSHIPLPPSPPAPSPSSSSPFRNAREYQLSISPSNMNHATYIERQGYYGGFNPDTRSMMAEDLEGRVPMAGLADCQIRRAEAPARVVAKWRERAAQRTITLRELWEDGRRERGE